MLQSSVTGDIGFIQSLLALDPNVLQSKNSHGLSTLQLSIINRHFRLAEYLVHAGIDVTLTDNFGWTALHDASLYSSTTLVVLLLQYGCNVLARTCKGEMAIDLAGDEDIGRLLIRKMEEGGHEELARGYRGVFDADVVENGDGITREERMGENREEEPTSNTRGHSRPVVNNTPPSHTKSNGINNSRSSSFSSVGGSPTHTRGKSRPNAFQHQEHKYKISNLTTVREESTLLEEDLSEDEEDLSFKQRESTSSPKRVKSPVLKRRREQQQSERMLARGIPAAAPLLTRSTSVDQLGITQAIFPRTPGTASDPRPSSARSSSDETMHITAEKTKSKRSIPCGRCSACAACEFEFCSAERETPIELLKMRPRKPSIVDLSRRRSSRDDLGESRRSVSFQPEVLLQEVVTEGDPELVKEIISSGVVDDVNKMSPVGLTALHQSALDGNLECARTLILNGADVNSLDSDGWSPLHAAAATGHLETVKFLLNAGGNPSAKNDAGQTPYEVAKKGNVKRLILRAAAGKPLLESDDDKDPHSEEEYSSDEERYSHVESDSEEGELCFSDDSETLSPWGQKMSLNGTGRPTPPLLDAVDSVFSSASSSSPIIPNSILKDRELSDSTSSYGSMIDSDSIQQRHQVASFDTSSLKTLCPSSPPPDDDDLSDTDRETTDQGFSTMDVSSDCSNRRLPCSDDEGTSRDVMDTDLEPGCYDYKFQEAVLNSDVDALLKLVKIKSQIDIDRVNKTSGISALHHSVLEENYTLVKHLVSDFKCDVNIKDVEGWTPLHAASAVGSIRIAQFLLENGAKASILNNNCEFPVDVTDEEGMSALLKKAMLGPSVGKLFTGSLCSSGRRESERVVV